MGEADQHPIPEPKREERPILPVSENAAKKALGDIKENPDRAYSSEYAELAKSEAVFRFLIGEPNAPPKVNPDFTEGALWAHRILRESAIASGQPLPNITEDDIPALARNMDDEVSAATDLANYYPNKLREIGENDKAFGDAINTLKAYRMDSKTLITGAVSVYLAYDSIIKTRNMDKQFGTGQQ